MPTGYTYPVLEGQSFEGFVWHCAQAFFHDPPTPLPLTKRWSYEDNSYPKKELGRQQTRLTQLMKITEDEWVVERNTANQEVIVRDKEYRKTKLEENKLLSQMAKRVEEWEPPTENHAALKAYMLDQLKISMNTHIDDEPYGICKRSLSDEIDRTKKEIEYHTTKLNEDEERIEERHAWIQELHRQIPQPFAKEILGR